MEYVAIAISVAAVIISVVAATKARRSRNATLGYAASLEHASGPLRSSNSEIEHRKEDLVASLRWGLADQYNAKADVVQAIVAELHDSHNSWLALRAVKTALGTDVFRRVLLYHRANQTSLWPHAETLIAMPSLVEHEQPR